MLSIAMDKVSRCTPWRKCHDARASPRQIHAKITLTERCQASSWACPTSILYDRLLSPFYDEVARLLWPRWVHPNCITLLGGLFCALSVAAMWHGAWGWACAAFTAYHACDNTDGKHARRTGQTSKMGHVLDHAVDATVGLAAVTTVCERVIFGCADHSYTHQTMVVFLTCHLAELATGRPMLGFRWFSVDEVNLLCSAALAWRACQADPAPSVLGLQESTCHITSHVLLLLLVGYAVASLAAAPRALLFLAAFGVVCVALPAPAPAALYAVAMAWLLLKNSKFLS